ncbi:hypothetical protein Ciccas_012925, partial [Cichlidogyrus casuarinus]
MSLPFSIRRPDDYFRFPYSCAKGHFSLAMVGPRSERFHHTLESHQPSLFVK